MRRRSGVSRREIRERDCAIRTAIGRSLSVQYGVAEPLPDRLALLLKRLQNLDEIDAGEARPAQSS
jgi:hypothetical protein